MDHAPSAWPFTHLRTAIIARLCLYRKRSRTRRDLARLDRESLDDIGLDEEMRRAEVARWFWQRR